MLPATYLNTRDITAIVMCGALWAVLNNTFAPIFWQLTHMPFLCDFLAFTSLILVTWWTRKFGAASLTGIIVTIINAHFKIRFSHAQFYGSEHPLRHREGKKVRERESLKIQQGL